jgi:hypothetical protein
LQQGILRELEGVVRADAFRALAFTAKNAKDLKLGKTSFTTEGMESTET